MKAFHETLEEAGEVRADMPRARKQVLLAHPGTQHAYRLAAQFERLSMLQSFHSGVVFSTTQGKNSLLGKLNLSSRSRSFRNRVIEGVPHEKIHSHPWNELVALLGLKLGLNSEITLHRRNRVFQYLVPTISFQAADAVVGFDTSSWILASRAREQGKAFFLDRTIAHRREYTRIMRRLECDFPQWKVPVHDATAELELLEDVEHDSSTAIVVAGRFAHQTLINRGVDAAKIFINPYGVDWDHFKTVKAQASADRIVRFLFVGSVIGRKGIPYLLEAWEKLATRTAQLVIAGPVGRVEAEMVNRVRGVVLLGPVPRSELPALYASCDAFVLPSLFEGFGLVILEALACGLPVLSTWNTGAADVITEPALGYVVDAGSADALAEKMEQWLIRRPSRPEVLAASSSLREKYSWNEYGNRWRSIIHSFDSKC